MRGKKEADIEIMEEVDTKKTTNTAFILMFPSLILAGMATLYAPSIWESAIAIALAFYQFLMLNKFVNEFYK